LGSNIPQVGEGFQAWRYFIIRLKFLETHVRNMISRSLFPSRITKAESGLRETSVAKSPSFINRRSKSTTVVCSSSAIFCTSLNRISGMTRLYRFIPPPLSGGFELPFFTPIGSSVTEFDIKKPSFTTTTKRYR